MSVNYLKKTFIIAVILILSVVIGTAQTPYEMKRETPFEKRLAPLEKPDDIKNLDYKNTEEYKDTKSQKIKDEHGTTYVYQPQTAFKLVVTQEEYPHILPDKNVFGVISLRITSDYIATSRVIYAKQPYKFDRLNWAIRTGWNDTIPFFSRLEGFRKYLKPFDGPVYAHFYINGVKEYPEYPGQYFHWPREALEDYYLYILQKIDSVASQN